MRPVIVLSTPRSGTSAVAGILHYLGVDMGKYYIRPDSQNPTGYFEDAQLVEMDYKYFEKDRETWYNKVTEYLKERKGLWGWKNPMLSVTINDTKAILKELNLKPRYIRVYRDIEDIKKSRRKHYGKIQLKQVKQHLITLDKALKDDEVLTLNFKGVVEKPHEAVGKIIEYLELKPTKDQITRAILSVTQPSGGKAIAVPSRLYK